MSKPRRANIKRSGKTKAELISDLNELKRRVGELESTLAARSDLERALRESERLFRDLFEGSIQGIVIQRDQKPLFVNQAYVEMHGYDRPDEILEKRTILDLVAPAERERFCRYNRSRTHGEPAPARYEFQAIKRDGTLIWLESVVTQITWRAAPAILSTLTDITERKQAANALRASEIRFRSLVENMRNIIFLHGTAGDTAHGYDSEGVSVYGQNAPALAGPVMEGKANIENWYRSIHPDDRDAYLDAERRRKEKGEDYTMEFRFFHPETGELRWAQECAWVVEDRERGRHFFDSYLLDITDRKRAELALLEGERRFKDFAEAASDWFWEMDENLRFTYLSDRILEASGVTPEYHYGKTRQEIGVPKDDPEKWTAHLATLQAHEPFRDFTFRRKGPDGRVHHIKTSGVPIFDDKGEFKGYRGVGSEITAEINMYDALRESEARFKAFIDNAPLLIAIKDTEGRCVLANRHYRYMFGVKNEAVIGATVFDLFDKENAETYWAHERQVLESGKVIEEEFVNQTVEGERILHEIKFPILDKEGRAMGLGFVGTDITSRKHADERFRQSEQRFLDVAEIASDWFWEMDENLRFTYFSERIKQVTGLDPTTDLLGRTREDVGKGDMSEEKWQRHLADLAARRPFRDFRYSYTGKNGRKQQWSVSGIPVFDDLGNFKGYRGTGTDVTAQEQAFAAQRQAMEQAEAANRAKSEFLANMSHELRTPLNAIIGFSEMMRDELLGPLGDKHYQQYSGDINDSGNHLLSLINDILDLSKIEAGKLELEEERIDLRNAIEASLRLIKPRADEARLTLRQEIAPDLPELRGDLRALKQIMLNLLSNAVKFTESGGKVTISAKIDPDGRPNISVADTGIGMAPEQLEVALSSFGQVDSPYTRQHQGTGLGLPLVKALAELHGGDFKLASTLGVGTTATVHLPVGRIITQKQKTVA